jgi:UDP-N-acetylglucosamine/UDP-N-acetylgalactosamine diphosphorylase
MDFEALRTLATRHGQGHLFTFWNKLDARQRGELLTDVAQIDFDAVARLIPTHVRAAPRTELAAAPEPAEAWPAQPDAPRRPRYEAARTLGRKLVAEGKVAAMIVAGGQGTRLGFDRPKGEFAISPVRNKPLFQLFAESILAAGRRFGGSIPWYIMTGPTTDQPTRQYFAEHAYFGFRPEDVFFFCQGVMPAIDREGRILLDQPHRVALSPNGHGGCLLALATSGALDDLRRRGIEVISYFQVDNPLVAPVDPLFLGLHALTDAEMSAVAVPKADDLERVGNFARVNGRTCVIEYSDLPAELAHARNPDGTRKFDDGSIAVHAFARTFLERLTQGEGSIALPWHRAEKKVEYVDLTTGQRLAPERPNAIKLELFVFDALPLAARTLVLRQERAECFSPVKNADGVDSPATARRDMSRRAARWLEAGGVGIPRKADGEPDGVFEISPAFALDAEHLQTVLRTPPIITPGGSFYLG